MNKRKKQIKEKKKEISSRSWMQKMHDFFDRNEKVLAVFSMVLGLVMCVLLFDVKVSLSGDDSDYIIFAENFWKHFTYPGYHGALYPILLSPFVGLFGYKLILLKIISCLFMLAFLWIFYKSFRGRVANIVLMPVMLLVSINSYVFFFASQTYSEALFMLTQGVFFFYFLKNFAEKGVQPISLKSDWKKYTVLGVLILMMGLTRSVGYGAIGAVVLFFAINRRWKELCYSVGAFGLIFIVFQLLKSVVWPDAGSSYNMDTLFAKDYYNPVERETLSGLFVRFKENSIIYLSAFLYQFMGLVKETPSNYIDIHPLRTILVYVLFAVSLVVVINKKKNVLLMAGLYVGVMNFISFVLLHTMWAQDRLIMVFYPFILLFLLGGIYYLIQIKPLQWLFFIYPVIVVAILIGTFSITKSRVARNLPVLQQNILGDQLYGLTPDWQNFIKASQWAAQNLDPEANIISRKSTISKVYTGRDFKGDPQALTSPLDSLLQLKTTEDQTLLLVAENSQYTLRTPSFKYLIGTRDNSIFTINNQETRAVYLYVVPTSKIGEYMQFLDESRMTFTVDYEPFFERCKDLSGVLRIYDPELMLDYLLTNKIDYLLLAQLRIDPTMNTGVYLNSIHRFVWYITCKYPNAFRTIHTEGKEEPCEIVQFVFE